jgi:hypothetical protein
MDRGSSRQPSNVPEGAGKQRSRRRRPLPSELPRLGGRMAPHHRGTPVAGSPDRQESWRASHSPGRPNWRRCSPRLAHLAIGAGDSVRDGIALWGTQDTRLVREGERGGQRRRRPSAAWPGHDTLITGSPGDERSRTYPADAVTTSSADRSPGHGEPARWSGHGSRPRQVNRRTSSPHPQRRERLPAGSPPPAVTHRHLDVFGRLEDFFDYFSPDRPRAYLWG